MISIEKEVITTVTQEFNDIKEMLCFQCSKFSFCGDCPLNKLNNIDNPKRSCRDLVEEFLNAV